MYEENSFRQRNAAEYFDRMAEKYGWSEADNIIVTGHSKGGNKAQYVTLDSANKDLIDTCYSLNGQGFSPEAIDDFKYRYGEEGYQESVNKMYSLRGENDYVSGLGMRVIPDEHTWFVETGDDSTDFVGHHTIETMIGSDGKLNNVTEQGAMSEFAERISEEMMKLPNEQRKEFSLTIMQVIEILNGGMWTGEDGTHASFTDISEFIDEGIPFIIYNLLFTEEGRKTFGNISYDMLLNIYNEDGLLGILKFTTAIFALAPLALSLSSAIYQLNNVINSVIDIYNNVKDFISEQVENLKDFLLNIWDDIKDNYDKFVEVIVGKREAISADYFSVNLTALYQAKRELDVQHRCLVNMLVELKTIRQNIDFGLISRRVLSLQLNKGIRQLNDAINKLNQMSECLEQVENQYKRNEGIIVSNYI